MTGGEAEMDRARRLVASAERIVVLTGAGVSAESGVPTFRGEDGLWQSHRPEELATPQAFRRDPALVWSWYAWRRERVAECRPNEGHRALARLALLRDGVTLVTQNVDGLHTVAAEEEAEKLGVGPEPAIPWELHGSVFRLRCSSCEYREEHRVPEEPEPVEPLHCPECRGLLRPDVVWFGEMLPATALDGAFQAAREADLALAVGTSAMVHPAASVPLVTADAGGTVLEVNPDATPLSRVASLALRGPAGELLPELLSSEVTPQG